MHRGRNHDLHYLGALSKSPSSNLYDLKSLLWINKCPNLDLYAVNISSIMYHRLSRHFLYESTNCVRKCPHGCGGIGLVPGAILARKVDCTLLTICRKAIILGPSLYLAIQ